MEYSSFRDESTQPNSEDQGQNMEYVPFTRPVEPVTPVVPAQVESASQPTPEQAPAQVVKPNVNTSASPASAPAAQGPSFKAILYPILGYLGVFVAAFVVGAFMPQGSAVYNTMMYACAILMLAAPIFVIVIAVRYFMLKKKAQ